MIEKLAEAAFSRWIASISMHRQMSENMQSVLRDYFLGGFHIGFQAGLIQKEKDTNERSEPRAVAE